MAMLAESFIRMRADGSRLASDIDKGTSKAAKDAGTKAGKQFSDAAKPGISGVGKLITGIFGAAIVVKGAQQVYGFLKTATKEASDLNETQSKVGQLFGSSAAQVEAFARRAATSLGETTQAALDGAATFGVFGRGAGLAGSNLATFSTKLVTLAGDMASFSNTSPEQAIEAIGSALRGERDPIEQYGVLLNDANIKARALSEGLVKATHSVAQIRAAQLAGEEAQKKYNAAVKAHGKNSMEAQKASVALGLAQERLQKEVTGTVPQLTKQQQVLATQKEIMVQTGAAQGDFARTSGGLANQQRILSAQFKNIRTQIGTALLPVVIQFVTALTTKLMPAMQALWQKHGPAISAAIKQAGDRLGTFLAKAQHVDWAAQWDRASAAVKKLGPMLQELKGHSSQLNDTLKVGGQVMKFLADHSDELGKAIPYLVVGYIALKTAQTGANAVAAVTPLLKLAELVANRQLTKSNVQLTAALLAQTGALGVGTVATAGSTVATETQDVVQKRSILSSVGLKIAMVAGAIATGAMTAAQWLLNAAMSLNPIGIVIIAIVALVAAIVIAYKNSETFRKIVQAAWKGIQVAVAFVVAWFKTSVWPVLQTALRALGAVFTWLWRNVIVPAWSGIQAVVGFAVKLVQLWWHGMQIEIRALAAVFMWLWRNIMTPVWNGIMDVIRGGWAVIKTIFRFLSDGVKAIGGAFSVGVGAAKKAWQALQDATRTPVKWIIDHIINPRIIDTFNAVSHFFSGPQAKHVASNFDRGGLIPGVPSPRDNLVTWGPSGPTGLATGEYVVNSRQTSKFLPLLHAINSGRLPGFADGGLVGLIESSVSWLSKATGLGDIAKWIESKVGLRDIARNIGKSPIAQTLAGIPRKLLDSLLSWAKDKISVFADAGSSGTWSGTIAPGALGKMQQFALDQRGKRYFWTAVGPGAYDCSGLVGNLWAIATGHPLYRRYFTTSNEAGFGGLQRGPGKFTVYLGPGHTAANVAGLHAEAYGGNGVPLAIGRIGTPLSYYTSKWHLPGLAAGGAVQSSLLGMGVTGRIASFFERGWPELPGLVADNGAWLPPRSTTAVTNNTGKWERVGFDGGVRVEAGAVQVTVGAGADEAMVERVMQRAFSEFLRKLQTGRRR